MSEPSISEFRKTLGQLMRWKDRARQLEQELLQERQQYEALVQQNTALNDELNGYYSDKELEPENQVRLQDELMQELEGYRRDKRVGTLQRALEATGKIRKGVKFEQLARLKGLDVDSITPEQLEESGALIEELLTWANSDAPYLIDEATPEPTPVSNETTPATGRPSLPVEAIRRLPTFASSPAGGGSPPPVEIPNSIARLRDPADALRRAAEGQAQRAKA